MIYQEGETLFSSISITDMNYTETRTEIVKTLLHFQQHGWIFLEPAGKLLCFKYIKFHKVTLIDLSVCNDDSAQHNASRTSYRV
jgi:hypothetical protein